MNKLKQVKVRNPSAATSSENGKKPGGLWMQLANAVEKLKENDPKKDALNSLAKKI